MKKDRLLRTILIVSIIVFMMILVKANVTLSREPKDTDDKTSRTLEVTSELVQNLYTKLTLIDDSLKSDNYKYAYFTMDSNEKTFSNEELLYMTIEDMYQNNKFELVNDGEYEKATISESQMNEEIERLFKGIEFDAKNLNFAPSPTCGIVDYLYTGNDFTFTFAKCSESIGFSKSELQSARKEGNYVILRIKSYYATYHKKTKKQSEDYYIIRNYNSDEELKTVNKNDLYNQLSSIMNDLPIEEYDFYFELRGEDYYLSKTVRVNKEN